MKEFQAYPPIPLCRQKVVPGSCSVIPPTGSHERGAAVPGSTSDTFPAVATEQCGYGLASSEAELLQHTECVFRDCPSGREAKPTEWCHWCWISVWRGRGLRGLTLFKSDQWRASLCVHLRGEPLKGGGKQKPYASVFDSICAAWKLNWSWKFCWPQCKLFNLNLHKKGLIRLIFFKMWASTFEIGVYFKTKQRLTKCDLEIITARGAAPIISCDVFIG